MTERLYYRDATLQTFTAHVTSIDDTGRRVYLDRTAFYPTSGGQPHDTGTLAGRQVVDVVDEGERIAHVLEAGLTTNSGDVVEGRIDWQRRHDHMQQHSGQHLLSAVCDAVLGLRTVSVHFGAQSSTIDLEGASGLTGEGVLADSDLQRIAQRANDIVAEARPVTVSFEDARAVTDLRKASTRTGTLRIVSIDGIDRSACGGTHVSTTSEIGPIMLRGQERVRSAVRITFICGERALARSRRDYEILSDISAACSALPDDLPAVLERQSRELKELSSANRRTEMLLAECRAAQLWREAAPGPDGIRRILQRYPSGGADAGRHLALAINELARIMFVAVSHDPPSVLLATSADSGIEAGRMLRPMLEAVGGRGGGSSRLAQGSVPSVEAVESIVRQLALQSDE